MSTSAPKTSETSGITGFSGPGGTVIRFDTRQPEARAAIMASLDRLAAMPPKAPPIVPTEAHRAAVLARNPAASPELVGALAQIEATFFGGRV